MPNIPEDVIALFGTWMAGGVVVPVNPLLVTEEMIALRRLTACRFVVCLDRLLPLLAQEEDPPDVVFVTTLSDRLPWINSSSRTGSAACPA